MGLLKGPRISNYVHIRDNVRFLQRVEFSFANPWSRILFVDGINGSDNDDGLSPENAKATIQAAVNIANRDDVIYVRAKGGVTDASDFDYYSEKVIIPYALVNLSIVGVTPHAFKPYYGPWIRYGYGASHTGYVLLNYAPGLCLENLGFQVGDYIRASYGAISMYSSVTGGAYTTHAGSVAFTVHNCFCRDGQLNINGGYDGVIHGCTFEASGDSKAGVYSTDNVLPTGGHRIINSKFNEMFVDNPALRYIYFVAGQQVNFLIKGCTFGLMPADNHFMWFGGSNKGLVADCFFQHDDVVASNNDGTSEIYTADGGVIVAGCYDQSGLVTTS